MSELTDFGFTGQRLDRSTGGLMYYNARYYLPELRRFISPDTVVPGAGNPQNLNRYAYVRNNPVRYVDPSGHALAPTTDPDDIYNPITREPIFVSARPPSPPTLGGIDALLEPTSYASQSGTTTPDPSGTGEAILDALIDSSDAWWNTDDGQLSLAELVGMIMYWEFGQYPYWSYPALQEAVIRRFYYYCTLGYGVDCPTANVSRYVAYWQPLRAAAYDPSTLAGLAGTDLWSVASPAGTGSRMDFALQLLNTPGWQSGRVPDRPFDFATTTDDTSIDFYNRIAEAARYPGYGIDQLVLVYPVAGGMNEIEGRSLPQLGYVMTPLQVSAWCGVKSCVGQ